MRFCCIIAAEQIHMVLSFEQIRDVILNNPNKELIKKGRDYTKVLRAHLRGHNKEETLPQINGFERPSLHDLRVKYSKSNVDLFARLSRPIDKVFSAKGGSVYYNLPESQEKKARSLSANVRDGYSAKKWIETFWTPHYLDDPYGVLMMEVAPIQEALRLRDQGLPFTYPTYKCIEGVFDYLPKGSALEYICFPVPNSEKEAAGYKADQLIYRLVDDAKDYWVLREGEAVVLLNDHTYPNYFGYCPCIINSDIIDPTIEGGRLSLFDSAIELADQFLAKGSIKTTHDFMHGFPKYSEYASSCEDCGGAGMVSGENCKSCKGTGKKPMTKVSDVKMLAWPEKDDVVIEPSKVGGYVSPDKTYWEIATADLSDLENLMNFTIWGCQSGIRTQGMIMNKQGQAQTATEIMSDIQPQSDRLEVISDAAQSRQKFIIDATVQLCLPVPTYPGSSVHYGRRYMLEGPDVIWMKYSDARIKGAAISVLDDLLLEYYEAKYSSDPAKLAIQVKLMKVEPFIHMTAVQVGLLPISPEAKTAKLYFGDWLAEQNDAMILTMPVDMLRKDLAAYAKERVYVEPVPVVVP